MTAYRFLGILILVSGGLFYSALIDFYTTQNNQSAKTIAKEINTDLSQLTYSLTNNFDSEEVFANQKKRLNFVVAENPFIQSIAVFDGSRRLWFTDPSIENYPEDAISSIEQINNPYQFFLKPQAFMKTLRVRQGNVLRIYLIYALTDTTEIKSFFAANERKFFIYFVLIPSFYILLILGLFHRYWVRPLKTLQKFAYYHDRVPPKQRLREIESIRYSMENTFRRLDDEQKTLYRNARTDPLSGLSNRQALQEYLKQTIADSEKNHSDFAFLFLDFDDFKAVNDSLGHDIGDQVIREASRVLVSGIHNYDFIARVGGDEFVIILKHYQSLDALGAEIRQLQTALKEAILGGELNIHINSSVGVAFYPKDGEDYLSLMQKADIAMFQAKREGKSRYHFYSESLNERVQKNISLDKTMRQALLNDEYYLFYQPKIHIETQTVIGAEALIRWIRPDGEMISPVKFIPLAEENGFIIELGQWVLETALQQLQHWQNLYPDFVLSINVATKQLLEDGFLESFKALMTLYEIHPKNVDLEITEYLFFEQSERNTGIIDELRELGVSISLDDFGTGFSSLSYIKKFHVDQIKIDKAFIDDYDSESGAIFIETIIRMSESLHKKLIAEGVETEQQAQYLSLAGCHYAQGYLFSKPLPLADFEAYYQIHKPQSI